MSLKNGIAFLVTLRSVLLPKSTRKNLGFLSGQSFSRAGLLNGVCSSYYRFSGLGRRERRGRDVAGAA